MPRVYRSMYDEGGLPTYDNPHYRTYEEQLIRLHRLFAQGPDDTPEVDQLQSEMEISGSWLSRPEAERLGGLSGDLYQLQEDEIYNVLRGELAVKDWQLQRDQALERGDWCRVLGLLRNRPADLDPAYVAWLRYLAYSRLGHWKPAAAFITYAIEKKSQPRLLWDALEALERAGDFETARQLGRRFEATEPEDLYWLVKYVSLLQVRRGQDPARDEEAFRHAAAQIRWILSGPGDRSRLSASAIAYGYLSLAVCALALGNEAEASAAAQSAALYGHEDPGLARAAEAVRRSLTPAPDDLGARIAPEILQQLSRAPSRPDTVLLAEAA